MAKSTDVEMMEKEIMAEENNADVVDTVAVLSRSTPNVPSVGSASSKQRRRRNKTEVQLPKTGRTQRTIFLPLNPIGTKPYHGSNGDPNRLADPENPTHSRTPSLAQAFAISALHGMRSGALFKHPAGLTTVADTKKSMVELDQDVQANQAQSIIWKHHKWVVPLVCTSFFITKTFQPILLQWNRENGRYPFAPTSSIWMSRVILTAFFSFWVYSGGDRLSCAEWRASLPFAFVALCTVGNVLSIYLTVEFLGAGAYAVLKNLNLCFTAVLLVVWLKKQVTPAQWSCTVIITLSTFIFRIEALEGELNPGYIFVLMGVVASTLEGILLQIVTRQLPTMSFQKQSFFYHFYSMILSFFLMISYDHEIVFSKGPFHGWNYKLAIYLICVVPLVSMKHAVAGLASAIMVKLIVAGTTVSTFVLAIPLFSTSSKPIQYLAAVIICVALVCYQMEGHRLKAGVNLKLEFYNGGAVKKDSESKHDDIGESGSTSHGDSAGQHKPLVVQCGTCKQDVVKIPATISH